MHTPPPGGPGSCSHAIGVWLDILQVPVNDGNDLVGCCISSENTFSPEEMFSHPLRHKTLSDGHVKLCLLR